MTSTDFRTLFTYRINKVLMICSNYDAFIMEEDGRIESRITQEYIDLNISDPPTFIWANTAEKAGALLDSTDDFDMIICMFNDSDKEIFPLAARLKAEGRKIPFVLLMHYSKEIRRRVTSRIEDIDFIFSWHGNADLILAIIKLFEDKRNADHDILDVGVQAILLVEDSIRYYSTYLPELYKMVLMQSNEFVKETLNEEQKRNLKRFRPKILLETCYEDAVTTYKRYQNNFLGIITDVGMVIHRGDNPKTEKLDAGIDLVTMIRKDEPLMPVLMQSSQGTLAETAKKLGASFMKKYSRTLFSELAEYMREELCFGDFVFRDSNGTEYARASNLLELQEIVDVVPDNALVDSTSKNMFSKWLFARGLFNLGRTFRSEHHIDGNNARSFIKTQIRAYLKSIGRGIIARFDEDTYEDYITFARLGDGSLGGKARGLAFLNSLVEKYSLTDAYPDMSLSIPRSIVISTDYFDQFIEQNGLQYIIDSELSDDEILSEFVASRLPEQLIAQLRAYLKTVHTPLAIRSSSKLEDSNYQPFAGVYSTYMIPNAENREQMLRMLDKAIKSVYASAYYNGARTYIHSTGNLQSEEKMAVIVQSICGSDHKGFYYPLMSGVARSINFYPIGNEKAEDGIVNLAVGLGKTVVDGGRTLRFSPRFPKKILQLSKTDIALKETQPMMYALDLRPGAFKISRNEGVNFINVPVSQAVDDLPFPQYVFSTYDGENDRINPGVNKIGPRIVSYDYILKYDRFPVAKAIREIMDICRKELMSEVELEFAADLSEDGQKLSMKLLQIRPISEYSKGSDTTVEKVEEELKQTLVRSERALGVGYIEGMKKIVYVPADRFDNMKTVQIAAEIADINNKMKAAEEGYLLIGPGRWGSSVQSLGVPVIWSDISEARMIVECGIPGFQIEPSQGTHFFQNITSLGVGYLSVDLVMHPEHLNIEALSGMRLVHEGKYAQVYEAPGEIKAYIDRNSNKAIVGLV